MQIDPTLWNFQDFCVFFHGQNLGNNTRSPLALGSSHAGCNVSIPPYPPCDIEIKQPLAKFSQFGAYTRPLCIKHIINVVGVMALSLSIAICRSSAELRCTIIYP